MLAPIEVPYFNKQNTVFVCIHNNFGILFIKIWMRSKENKDEWLTQETRWASYLNPEPSSLGKLGPYWLTVGGSSFWSQGPLRT